MRLRILALAVGVIVSYSSIAQDDSTVNVREIRDAAMKTVEIKVKPISSSSIRRTMDGGFYQTYIERSNGDTFIVAQVNEVQGVIRSFYIPEKTEKVDVTRSFIKNDYVMIENTEARQLLSALRMIYNIDTVFPMYVNRFRDRWVLLVDSHEDKIRFVGFTAKIDGEGIIKELVYSNEITLSEAQRDDIGDLNKTTDIN